MSRGFTTAAARTVLAPLEGSSGGLPELIARRLGDAIRLGLIADGERLPAESELAARFGVSPVTLREALTLLREQGLVTTRRGRGGGSFVHAPADAHEPLRRFSVSELRDLGDQRAAILSAAAGLAAQRADPEEIRHLRELLERRRADAELAIAVAAAAQSPRLTHEEARLRSELGDLLRLGDVEDDALPRALVEAIAKRRPARAREVAARLVAAETERLIALRLAAPDLSEGEPLEVVARELDVVFAALGDLGARFAELEAARRDDLEPLRPAILALLADHPDLLTGAGIVTAPGLLADAPRWLEWWWLGPAGAAEALRVNLDPGAPDFYDYTATAWYATDEPRLAGPYVDYACTNQYAITMAVPVHGPDGAFLGVAAADVLLSRLERRVAPALAALAVPVALTNADGRVIASSEPSVAAGRRLRWRRGAERAAPVRDWLLVPVPSQA
ncbi:MAG TPA: GntR family transcriptional regulator [Baekduia sp.]|uniref:GntR family transcriptional regulator n=1 Tax=Baekduia sp. TaxID=2600305 RepID=UPI002D77E8FD|nr:GntR family transcriptional regulator [Baekduia sp.]HET6505300.1 GntR family transcriptional regulator [Baekduia sp.]